MDATKTTLDFSNSPRLALGLLRLCTEGRPDEIDAISIIHCALDAGIRILDTADSYCLSNQDFHYGEALVRKAISTWNGPQSHIRVMTKVGFVRPSGKWLPNGSPKHIRKSVEQSLVAFQVDRIEILQLHARDPRVPFEETLEELAKLQSEGKVAHLGLCNVSLSDVRLAQQYFPVALLQCELSVQSRKSATDGLVAMAKELGIPFFAYRPLGGYSKVDKLNGNRVLNPLALRHHGTPHEIALAAVLDTGDHVIPLIGATKYSSIESSLRACHIRLDQSDRTTLAIKYSFEPSADALASLKPVQLPANLPTLTDIAGPSDDPEVVIIMGIQGAGKSELVQSYQERGYARLNRDELGGKLEDLLPMLATLLSQGQTRVVLDNTYPTRLSRAGVVRIAHDAGVPVRCRWLDTGLNDARINVTLRMLGRYGRLLGADDIKQLAKQDPNLPPPLALQKWVDSLEVPSREEGFSAIERIPFVRRQSTKQANKAVFLDVDGTLRTTFSGEIYPRVAQDVVLMPNRKNVLQPYVDEGYLLFFVSNQSGITSGKLTLHDAQSAFLRTAQLLELPITEIAFCPHAAFPVGCFCRKPMPGLGVYLANKYHVDLCQSLMVGDMDSDRDFAISLGLEYIDAQQFFG